MDFLSSERQPLLGRHFYQSIVNSGCYLNLPAPFGIANVRREMIIDLDEVALFLESSNRDRGEAHLIRRCREVGPYGHSEKLNILVAISGEEATPGNPSRRWVETWNEGGTTTQRFIAIIRHILQDIGQGTPQRWHCFTMDNLNTHRDIIVMQMIHAAGHRYPVDSAIEHLFNTIQISLMMRMYELNTSQAVQDTFFNALRSMRSFAASFEHVGIM